MGKARLLIVEDDLDIANMLRIYFNSQGYDVDLAPRGVEAGLPCSAFLRIAGVRTWWKTHRTARPRPGQLSQRFGLQSGPFQVSCSHLADPLQRHFSTQGTRPKSPAWRSPVANRAGE